MSDETKMISIHIMGKHSMVPGGLTIMRAMEWAGHTLVRGVGCRGGFCGACSTVYRVKNDHKLYFGLACQTMVKPDMYLGQIPFFPAKHAHYRIGDLKAEPKTLYQVYPEIFRCLGCGTCSKACPQELNVKSYMAAAMRGNISEVAALSFDCIMCGLCVARCPAEEPQYNIAILSRRLHGRYLSPRSGHLAQRIQEINEKRHHPEISRLKAMDVEQWKDLYKERVMEN